MRHWGAIGLEGRKPFFTSWKSCWGVKKKLSKTNLFYSVRLFAFFAKRLEYRRGGWHVQSLNCLPSTTECGLETGRSKDTPCRFHSLSSYMDKKENRKKASAARIIYAFVAGWTETNVAVLVIPTRLRHKTERMCWPAYSVRCSKWRFHVDTKSLVFPPFAKNAIIKKKQTRKSVVLARSVRWSRKVYTTTLAACRNPPITSGGKSRINISIARANSMYMFRETGLRCCGAPPHTIRRNAASHFDPVPQR